MSIPLNRQYLEFTIPPLSQARNCSGTVMAIQHCYHADLKSKEIGKDKDIFEFLSDINQIINDRFMVRSASDANNCVVGKKAMGRMPHDCCSTFTLAENNRFLILNSNYTFGVGISNTNRRPYAFKDEITEFNVNQYQVPSAKGDSLAQGSRLSGHSLFLMKFLIGTYT